jgi:DNA repair protein RecO (recombination protein O)
MEEQTSGLILRTRPLTETSLIVQWITPDLGRIATVAKGARRPKSPFTGKLDLFYESQFSFLRSRKSDLHTLKEVKLLNPHSRLRQSLEAITLGSYFAVLVEYASETETPVPELWELFRKAIENLQAIPASAGTLFTFEWNLLLSQGYEPDLDAVRLSSGARRFLENIDNPCLNELSRTELTEVSRFLLIAIGRSFERVPSQRQAALDILRIH